MESNRVCVRETNGDADAQQVKTFLEAHDVPCELRGESLRLTHRFTLDGLGVVRVYVLPEHAERAKALLARADAGEFKIDGTQP